jgi:hypothetical protein
MRSMFRTVLVALLAVLALGAVASASASAHEWKVNGSPVVAAKEVTFSGGSFEMEVRAFSFSAKCRKVSGKGDVEAEGKGKATELKLTECTTNVIESPECLVKSAGAPARAGEIILAGIPTVLVERESHGGGAKKLADEFKENATKKEMVKLEVGKEEETVTHKLKKPCGKFGVLNTVKGEIAAEVSNAKEELIFPSPELEGNSLSFAGWALTWPDATVVQKVVGGGTLEGV